MSITPSPLSGSSSGSSLPPQPPVYGKPSYIPIIILALVMAGGMGWLYQYTKGLSDKVDALNATLNASLDVQRESVQKLGKTLEKTEARATDLEGAFSDTQNKIGATQNEIQKAHQAAAELAKQQKETAEQFGSKISEIQQDQVSTKGAVGSLSTDLTGVKGDVQSTRQDLAATKNALQSVVGDLGVQSGLIARNKGELDELRMRGERDYVEFDLKKANQPQRVGNIQLELKKTDPKKGKYTIGLITDDKSIEKKDKTILEPVQFYQQGVRTPAEIVVNQVYKDRIVGYLSTSKKVETRAPMK